MKILLLLTEPGLWLSNVLKPMAILLLTAVCALTSV